MRGTSCNCFQGHSWWQDYSWCQSYSCCQGNSCCQGYSWCQGCNLHLLPGAVVHLSVSTPEWCFVYVHVAGCTDFEVAWHVDLKVLGSLLSRTMLLSIEVAVEYWLSLTWSPQAQWLSDSTHDSPLREEVSPSCSCELPCVTFHSTCLDVCLHPCNIGAQSLRYASPCCQLTLNYPMALLTLLSDGIASSGKNAR